MASFYFINSVQIVDVQSMYIFFTTKKTNPSIDLNKQQKATNQLNLHKRE